MFAALNADEPDVELGEKILMGLRAGWDVQGAIIDGSFVTGWLGHSDISQLVASGLGYIDFALNHPALFRVVFSSGRPVHSSAELLQAATEAFGLLERDVTAIFAAKGGVPARTDVLEVWAITHGLADLLNGGRMKWICDMRKAERDQTVAAMLRTSLTELASRAQR